jgi:cell division septation protein DedD
MVGAISTLSAAADRADVIVMDDNFSFGEPGKQWSPEKLHARAPRAREAGERPRIGRAVFVGVGAVALVGLVVVFLSTMKSGGEAAADAASSALDTVGDAQNAQAEVTVRQAQTMAMQLFAEGTAEGPSYLAATPEALAAMDAQYTYTTGASTGPTVVSVAATADEWAAAVRSDSGTCAWVHLQGSTATSGSGPQCSGQAALSA